MSILAKKLLANDGGGGYATIELVGTLGGGMAGATSGNEVLDITSLGLQEGDFLLAIYCTGSSADRTLSILDGSGGNTYTLLDELYSNDTEDANFRAAYKIMGATPDTAVTFGPTGNTADAGNYEVRAYRGVDTSNPLDVSIVTSTGLNTFLVDPPAITPVTPGAWVVVVGMGAHTQGATFVYTSPDLSNFVGRSRNDNNDCSLGSGDYVWTSGEFNPGQWSHGGIDSATYAWCAITLALRPATL